MLEPTWYEDNFDNYPLEWSHIEPLMFSEIKEKDPDSIYYNTKF